MTCTLAPTRAQSAFGKALLLAAALGFCSSASAFSLTLFPGSQMRAMGAQAYAKIKQETPISKDQQATAEVMCVAHALTRVVGGQWEVTLFDSKQVNAFALPGGKIGVYSGLLKVATTPDQLAAVIGHEIGHVLAEHANERASTSMLADLGLKLLAGFTDLGESQAAMTALGLGTQVGVMLPFSRNQEAEADEIGIKLMAKAGFDPSQAVVLWKHMRQASKGEPWEILSTHPSNGSRIKDLARLAPRYQATYQRVANGANAPHCQR